MSENLIGATTAVFPIRLSVAVASPVDVEWSTRDGSAIAGSDYKAAAGTVTFLPGETEKQIEVQVYGQAITPADDKVFFIRLNPPSNAVLVDAILTCTINIIDDQGIPSVAVVVAEGRRGPKGDPGLSAYEQAVLMGYSGTLAEWMDQIADASKAADRAGDHAISASEDALKAQNAAKNAVFAGVIFPTAEEGVDPVLGVQNGAYFNVRSPLSEHYIDEYQNVNGVAVATGKSYPTSDYVQDISEHIALPFVLETVYKLNQRVVLTNGDIVKSTVDGNVNNPNSDMTGWVKTNSASQVLDANGLSQQDINDSSKLLSANVLDFFTESELMAWKADPNAFDASDAIIRVQTLSSGAEITFPTGTFRITKKIPSTKSWRGVRGGYTKQGTHIVVDNTVAIDGVIDCSAAHVAVELHDIQFEDKQRLLHTLLIEGVYQGFYSGIRVDRFKVGIQTSGTYIYFEKCYFVANGVGIRPTPTANVRNAQSTMFGCRECFFIYNDIGYDVSGVSAADDLINVPFISCGFELNRIGLNSPNRTWYLTLLNCWFEANSDYGLYAPTSHLIEINTRHNENSPFVVSPTASTKIFGMTASFVDLEIKGGVEIKGDVTSNIKFHAEYSSTGAAAKGKTISQTFTDDGGGATAEIAFVREKTNNNYGGSGIEFSTAVSTTSPTMYARWGISRYGVLYPKVDATYSIGNPTSRCSAVHTTKVMYTETVGDFYGSGSPEGVVTASVGSTYRRVDGTEGQPTFYTKVTGLGNTGWKAVTITP